ncbi:MAG: hypothetical protein K2G51_10830 [Lachnospiraceae bacterium]|nr:hypothetical protein [Lachnospiraceae bacterium]
MEDREQTIKTLQEQVTLLRTRVEYLESLLNKEGVSYCGKYDTYVDVVTIRNTIPKTEEIQ